MDALDRADAYLTIPESYAEALGIQWSHNHESIVYHDGSIHSFAAELLLILDGAFATEPGPPFAFVVQLLHWMKTEGRTEFAPLREAFESTRQAANRRNAGLLIAELCRELPSTASAVTSADLAAALQCLRVYGTHFRSSQVQELPLTREEFEQRVAARLARYSNGDLVHWLTHGTGPSPVGDKLAAETESLPVRVARLLALARKRQRLVGAALLVPALDAGLTLPPRRHSPDAPPQGGYCDVTTRGEPEHLLPTQFALDQDEFIRRFAAKELLYFQREEPHQPELPERVIILDQGVRTWGSVRLALAAAAFSLLTPRAKRCASIRLFLTSARGPIDITGHDVETIADLLESSDLSPDPEHCLKQALHQADPDTPPRDVILLTHPRALRKLTVPETSRRASDRVFALSVDERGRAELAQWSSSGLTAIRNFRVDLVAAEAARPEVELTQPRSATGDYGEWIGAVEPIPFPFRVGLVAEAQAFAFDADGEWLVTVGQNGVLHGLTLDGSPAEVLPRAFLNGVVLHQVDAVLGVTGGVVVCGRTQSEREPHVRPQQLDQVVAHYDRATRHVTVHNLGPALFNARWYVYPDLHCIAVRTETVTGGALDLATQGRYPNLTNSGLVSRARMAWERSAKAVGSQEVMIMEAPTKLHDPGSRPYLIVTENVMRLLQTDPPWKDRFAPTQDGKPLLEGATIHRAMLAGSVLALAIVKASERKIVTFRGPEGSILGEVAHPVRNTFMLSSDGRLLVRRDATRSVVVSATTDPARTIATAVHAGLHNALDIRLDAEPFRLTIAIGTFAHTFRLLHGVLRHSLALGWDNFPEPKVPLTAQQGSPVVYDTARFPASEGAASGLWRAVLDRLGQVLLFANGKLVAVFLVRRERIAAWLPGGVFWGAPALIGGPATPDAEKMIGKAILLAGG